MDDDAGKAVVGADILGGGDDEDEEGAATTAPAAGPVLFPRRRFLAARSDDMATYGLMNCFVRMAAVYFVNRCSESHRDSTAHTNEHRGLSTFFLAGSAGVDLIDGAHPAAPFLDANYTLTVCARVFLVFGVGPSSLTRVMPGKIDLESKSRGLASIST